MPKKKSALKPPMVLNQTQNDNQTEATGLQLVSQADMFTNVGAVAIQSDSRYFTDPIYRLKVNRDITEKQQTLDRYEFASDRLFDHLKNNIDGFFLAIKDPTSSPLIYNGRRYTLDITYIKLHIQAFSLLKKGEEFGTQFDDLFPEKVREMNMDKFTQLSEAKDKDGHITKEKCAKIYNVGVKDLFGNDCKLYYRAYEIKEDGKIQYEPLSEGKNPPTHGATFFSIGAPQQIATDDAKLTALFLHNRDIGGYRPYASPHKLVSTMLKETEDRTTGIKTEELVDDEIELYATEYFNFQDRSKPIMSKDSNGDENPIWRGLLGEYTNTLEAVIEAAMKSSYNEVLKLASVNDLDQENVCQQTSYKVEHQPLRKLVCQQWIMRSKKLLGDEHRYEYTQEYDSYANIANQLEALVPQGYKQEEKDEEAQDQMPLDRGYSYDMEQILSEEHASTLEYEL